MDPVSIGGLVGTCLAISGKIVSITAGLQQIVGAFKKADKDIKRISNQLDVFNATIEQLRIWLDRNRSLSSSFRKTISTAFEHCDVIVSDIEEQLQTVQPEPGQSKSSFSRKLKHLWNDNIIKEYERMISNQFIAFTTVIQVVYLNGLTELDKLKRLQTKSTKQLFATAAEDAKSITESKSTASRIGDYTSDNGENLSMEFSIDKEITRSKPYVKHYRTLVHAQFRSGRPKFNTISEDLTAEESESNVKVSTAPTTHTPQSAQGPPTPPVSQGRGYSSEALQIWDLYREETRIKVAKLCAAARRGDLDNVRSLIESGAIIDAHDEEGDTPLLCAIEFCHFEVALFLLDAGASVHLRSHIESREDSTDSKTLRDVYSPIHLAAEVGSVDITNLLIDFGANVNDSRCELAREYGDQGDIAIAKNFTPLHLAAYGAECKVATQLINHHASVSAQDSDGATPLMIAVAYNNVCAVQMNLEAGAPVNLKDNDGFTPFEISCNELSNSSQESLEVFVLLIKHGANIETCGNCYPPIIQLCFQPPFSELHSEALSLLLQAGADPNVEQELVDESEKLRSVTLLACMMPERHFWSNGADKGELAIRVKMINILQSSGVRGGRWSLFPSLTRLMHAFFKYCEDMRHGFAIVLAFTIYLVKAGAKFSDTCPYQIKQEHFREESRRTGLRKRILCALHIVAEHTDKSHKRPGDFMAATQGEFARWVAGGCHRDTWPWPIIPFDTEQHFKTHRTGGLVGWILRSVE